MTSSIQQGPVTGEKIKLFISYSKEYREDAVLRMVKFLRKRGCFEVSTRQDNMTGLTDETDAAIKSIDEADCVVCFLTKDYFQCKNCWKEIEFSANNGKLVIPVIVEPNCKPATWLEPIFTATVQVDYLDLDSPECLSMRIGNLIISNLTMKLHYPQEYPSSKNDFRMVGVPYLVDSNMFEREAVEEDIICKLKNATQGSEGGIVVTYGDDGLGKSSLLAGMVYNPLKRSVFAECGIRRVLWVNCYRWRNIFDEEEFYSKIITLAEEMDMELQCNDEFRRDGAATKKFLAMLKIYQKRNIRCAFIFDDVFNGAEIVSFFEKHRTVSTPVCIVIGRNSLLQKFQGMKASEICVKGLREKEMKEMLAKTFELHKLLNDQQIEKLAPLCHGLPLIGCLRASRIGFDSNQAQAAYEALLEGISCDLQKNLKIDEQNKGQSSLTVSSLLSFNLDQLTQSERMSYYAFLLFNPEEPVEIADLAVLWGESDVDVKCRCQQFERHCLVRRVEHNSWFWKKLKEDRFILHSTIFEAALIKASSEFLLPENTIEADRLYEIRQKIISGEVNCKDSEDESGFAILQDFLNRQNVGMVNRIIQLLSAEDLADILHKKSPLANGQSLIDFACGNDSFLNTIFKKMRKDIQNAKVLLEMVPQLSNITEKYSGKTAFHYASKHGQLEIVEILQQKAPKLVNVSDNNGWTALHYACLHGHLKIVKFLFEKAPQLVYNTDKKGCTAIHYASATGHLKIVKFIIKKAPGIVSVTSDADSTILHSATKGGHLEIVEFLLENAPNLVKITNNEGETGLHLASLKGHLEIVKLLIETVPFIANVTNYNGETALHLASQKGYLDTVRILLEKSRQLINITDNYGKTALLEASWHGHLDIVKLLLEKVPQIGEITDKNGATGLHYASKNGQLKIVRLLLEKAPHLADISNNIGETALHLASQSGHLEIVKFLLGNAPQLINITDKNSKTALLEASEKNHVEIVKLLLERAHIID